MLSVLTLAFGLGMLHALDADHIMTVSSLSSARPGWRTSLGFCARWAIGHAASLWLIGASVYLFGRAIPVQLSEYAEAAVGAVLLAIGVWLLWDLWVRGAHLHFHEHDGLRSHAHWHRHTAVEDREHRAAGHRHTHSAVLVGMLHGTAGSAPLLALIPIARLGSAWVAMGYLVLFGLGTLAAMLLFGGVLGGAYERLTRWGVRTVRAARIAVAASAAVFGVYLLHGVI